MKLDSYIKEILYTKDFVIVPDFGAFVCKHFNAEINPATQMFMPPSKKVVFQSAIQSEDLTLVNHVSKENGCGIDQAKLLIRQCVAVWQETLAQGKHVILDGIGRIYRNNNGDLSFQADINANFNTDTFGLAIYRFPKIKEETILSDKVAKVFPTTTKSTFSLAGYWKAAAMFVGVAGLFYLGTQKADFKNLNSATFNPLYFSKTTQPVEVKEAPVEEVSITYTEAEESIPHSTPVEVAPATTEEVAAPVQDLPYHVIVGAFKEENNAGKMIKELNGKGYAQAFYFYDKGFYKVSVDQFELKSQAKTQLHAYKTRVQKGAWIYKK